MARTKQKANKKRNRTAEQDDDLENQAREPQEMTLVEHLSNLYKSCNSESQADQPILIPSNVIVKTSFKEYNVHDFAVKRSGLFRTMIDSNEQWKLGKIDGKFNIDLSSVENSILPEGETSCLQEEDFDYIFNYLYSDEFESSYMDLPCLIRIYNIAKYLDIPSLINKMVADSHSINYLQIKYLLKGELTENDIIELVFKLEGYIHYNTHEYSDELVNYICKHKLVPLPIKIKLLKKKLSHNNTQEISKAMLKPYLECINVMREESKFIRVEENSEKEIIELLELQAPKEGEVPWLQKGYRCAIFATISMGACSDSYEESTINDQLTVEMTCSERSSAYWWDLKFITNFDNSNSGEEEKNEIGLKNRSFYKAHVGSQYEPIKEIDIFEAEETIYAPQFDIGGFSADFLFYFEKNQNE